jgi:hypothetical protein
MHRQVPSRQMASIHYAISYNNQYVISQNLFNVLNKTENEEKLKNKVEQEIHLQNPADLSGIKGYIKCILLRLTNIILVLQIPFN